MAGYLGYILVPGVFSGNYFAKHQLKLDPLLSFNYIMNYDQFPRHLHKQGHK